MISLVFNSTAYADSSASGSGIQQTMPAGKYWTTYSTVSTTSPPISHRNWSVMMGLSLAAGYLLRLTGQSVLFWFAKWKRHNRQYPSISLRFIHKSVGNMKASQRKSTDEHMPLSSYSEQHFSTADRSNKAQIVRVENQEQFTIWGRSQFIEYCLSFISEF